MQGSKNVNFSTEELILSGNDQYQLDPVCKCFNEPITYHLALFFFRMQLTFEFCILYVAESWIDFKGVLLNSI
jgi:hypothetical protein